METKTPFPLTPSEFLPWGETMAEAMKRLKACGMEKRYHARAQAAWRYQKRVGGVLAWPEVRMKAMEFYPPDKYPVPDPLASGSEVVAVPEVEGVASGDFDGEFAGEVDSVESSHLLDWLFHSIGDQCVTLKEAPSKGAFAWLQRLRKDEDLAKGFYTKYLDHTMKRAMADKQRADEAGETGKEEILVDEAGIERMIELCQTSRK